MQFFDCLGGYEHGDYPQSMQWKIFDILEVELRTGGTLQDTYSLLMGSSDI